MIGRHNSWLPRADLTARGLQLYGIDEAATLVALVTTGILVGIERTGTLNKPVG